MTSAPSKGDVMKARVDVKRVLKEGKVVNAIDLLEPGNRLGWESAIGMRR